VLTQDFADIMECLNRHNADFVLVGAFAMAYFGYRRATGDIDILVEPTLENSMRVLAALKEFGAPLSTHSVPNDYFSQEGNFYQIGIPPNRVDLITQISGVSYADARSHAVKGNIAGLHIPILSLELLIQNKKASGRTKDLIDLEELNKLNLQGTAHE
jgi:hypothetical protein